MTSSEYLRNCDRAICATENDRNSRVSLVRSLGPSPHCLEIGTWTGNTAKAMADAGAQVWCVDTWLGTDDDLTGRVVGQFGSTTIFDRFLENIGERHNKTIFPVVCHSHEAPERIEGEFDLIFIDADHSYEGVSEDIETWWPRVRQGGVLCGHDIQISFPGVIRAVVETGPYEVLPDTIWARRKD